MRACGHGTSAVRRAARERQTPLLPGHQKPRRTACLPASRAPRRPGPSGTAAHGSVILSDHDLAVIRKAVARARLDGKEDQQSPTAGRHGTDPGPDPPAPEARETRPPEFRWSAQPPATTQAPPAADPFWGTPPANTIRMRTRQRSRPTRARWRLTAAIILAAVLFCGGALTATLVHRSTAGNGAAARDQSAAAIASAAAARTAAARWVARQVDPAAIVACDPQMCAVLQSNGIPAGRLLLRRGRERRASRQRRHSVHSGRPRGVWQSPNQRVRTGGTGRVRVGERSGDRSGGGP